MKNYRPISNLSFLSKVLEKVVTRRLQAHIESNNLANPLQSAYRKFHSTETALLKMQNDISLNMDSGAVTALTLLDLSAAFDTIDHVTLINCLSSWYGISGSALKWCSSYLTDRSQKVKIQNCFSDSVATPYGVPQGSVLGPLLFTLYTTPLSQIIEKHDVNHHLYADDTQIYVSLSASDCLLSLEKLKSCVNSVSLWMFRSKLKLNPDKTEFLIIGSKKQREKISTLWPISLINQEMTPTDSARNLGVMFDCDFNFRHQISLLCRSCFYHIRDLRRIRRNISLATAKKIATALISSRLDYCNALFCNIADRDITKLQRVQNCLARVVCRAPRFSRSVPLLKSLHWLPVSYQIQFKLSTI